MLQPTDDARLSQVIADYLQSVDAGTPPDREGLITRHPQLADSLRAFFADQDRLEAAVGRPADPAVTLTLPPDAKPAGVPAPGLGTVRYFGDYELLEEIARGGMGVVFKARQVSLNRIVALKMILAGQLASEADVRRFRQEAEAAANLDHPNILPIYEVGDHQGQQYFSMKLIEGGSLADLLHEGPRTFDRGRELVTLLSQVARAVHHAHQRGILHRDLKPANVLLDRDRTPFVTDFGLAKKVEGDSSITQAGAVVGTPSYMAPEQARAEKQLSTASDVYSLGAILYQALTGQPPFKAATVAETLMAVMHREPADPRALNPAADRDLSVVAVKCLEKDPARRYESAGALAEDLDRWLAGEPIMARPVSRFERARKWARRHPAEVALLATIALAVIAGAVSTTYWAIKAEQRLATATGFAEDTLFWARDSNAHRERAEQALVRERETSQKLAVALDEARDNRRTAYVSDLARTANEWANNNVALAARLLDGCAPEFRGWEWHHLQRVGHAFVREFADVPGASFVGGFSPDGTRFLTVREDGVKVWDVATGTAIRTFHGHTQGPMSAAFFPDGKRIVSGSTQTLRFGGARGAGEVMVWEADTGRVLHSFGTAHGGVEAVAVSPDGRTVASVGVDDKVRLWDADTGKELFARDLPKAEKSSGMFRGVAFRPNSSHLAASASGGLVILDTKTRDEVRRLPDESLPQYTRDGRQLLTIKDSTTVTAWDLDSGKANYSYKIPAGAVFSVGLRADGARLAVGGYDGLVRVLDLVGKKEIYTLRGQQGQTMGLAYSPDGNRLVTSHGDPIFELFGDFAGRKPLPAIVRLWDADRAQDYRAIPYSTGGFAAHSREPLAFVAAGTEVHVHDLRTGEKVRAIKAAPESVSHLALSPDGTTLAVAWQVPEKRVKQLSPGVWEVKPDSHPGRLAILDPVTGAAKVREVKADQPCHDLAFSPDGATLAVARPAGRADLVDTATGNVLATVTGADSGSSSIRFTPDGRTLVRHVTGIMSINNAEPARLNPGAIEFWDVAGRRKDRSIDTGDERCHAVALSPDGRTLAAAVGEDVWLIDLSDPAAEQERIGAEAYALAFADGGRRLLTYTVYGVKVWDVRGRRDLLTLGGNWASAQGNTGRVAYSPSGYVLASEADGLRIYDGREFAAAATVVATKKRLGSGPKPGPKTDAPPDDRPEAVRVAVKQSIETQKDDPGASLLHAVAALAADADLGRQAKHRLRVALALQRHPKLRPVVPPGATAPSAFAADAVADPAGTANVSDPTEPWHFADAILIATDGRRLAAFNRVNTQGRVNEAKAAGRSPWSVRVFDAKTGRPVGPVIDLGQPVRDERIELSPDGKRVAAILHTPAAKEKSGEAEPSGPAVVRTWDVETGQRIGEDGAVPFRRDQKARLRFVGAGRILVGVSEEDRSPSPAWDAETMKPLSLPESFENVLGRDYSPYFVAATGDGPAVVWDGRTMKPVGKPLERSRPADAVVSADGSVAVLAHSFWAEAWDVRTGTVRHPRVLVRGGAKALAVSPDGSRFAAAYQGEGFKHLARVWDARTGDAVSPVIELAEDPSDLRFAAGGAALVSLTRLDVRVWDARTGELLIPPLIADGPSGFGHGMPMRFALVGDTLLCQRTPQTSQFDEWRLAPDDRPASEQMALAEALAGRRRSVDGVLSAIPADELTVLRREALAKCPAAFGGPVTRPEDVLARRRDPRTAQLLAILAGSKQPVGRRISACERLGELAAPEAQGPLTTTLRADPDARVRSSAARALAALTPLKPETVAGLLRSLREEGNAGVRASAARALHGPAAKQVTGELLHALKEDKSSEVRAGAAYALKDAPADGAGVRDALKAATDKSQPWQVRVDAAGSLAKLDPNDTGCVEVLAAAVAETKGGPQYVAIQHLHNLGPRAAPAVAALARVVAAEKYQSNFMNQTWHAVHALMRIGPAAEPAIPTLIQSLDGDEANPNWTSGDTNYPSARENAIAYTLGRIGKPAIPALLKIVREEKDAKRRRAAVIALGFMGPPAAEVTPELEKIQKAIEHEGDVTEDDRWLETAVKKALTRIRDPKAKPVNQLMEK